MKKRKEDSIADTIAEILDIPELWFAGLILISAGLAALDKIYK